MAQSFPVLGDLRCSPVSISRVRPEPSDFGIEVHSSSTPGSDSHGALEIDAACVVGELVRGLATRSYTPTELTAELQSVERACERALHSEAESHECSPQYLEGLTGDLQKCAADFAWGLQPRVRGAWGLWALCGRTRRVPRHAAPKRDHERSLFCRTT